MLNSESAGDSYFGLRNSSTGREIKTIDKE